MLAKLTAKNQLTLPKSIVSGFKGARYFDVSAESDRIVLKPVTVSPPTDVWSKLAELGITERDVEDAVKWARRKK